MMAEIPFVLHKTIKTGSVSLSVYYIPRGDVDCYRVVWYSADGKRKQKMFSKAGVAEKQAMDFAKHKAQQLRDLGGHGAELSGKERAEYVQSKAVVIEHGEGLSMLQAIHEWKAARAYGVDIIAACRDAADRRNDKPITVAGMVEQFIERKRERGLAEIGISAQESDLVAFTAAMGEETQISRVRAESITSFIDGHVSQSSSPRRWNNVLRTIKGLLLAAQKGGYLAPGPPDAKTEAHRIEEKKETKARIKIFTPSEMRDLLYKGLIRNDAMPWFILTSFAGLRSHEVAPDGTSKKTPLAWEDFRWDRGVIDVHADITKVGEDRLVPITEQVAAWLAPWRDRTGPVHTGVAIKRETQRINRILKKAHEEGNKQRYALKSWRKNSHRKSFGSYWLAKNESRSKLASIMGTSEAKIKANYREKVQFIEDAEEYLAMMPPDDWAEYVPFSRVG